MATTKYTAKSPEKEMWTTGFMHSWRKMQAAGHNRAGWSQAVSSGSDKSYT